MLKQFLLLQKSLVIHTVAVAAIPVEQFGGWDGGMRMNWMASIWYCKQENGRPA